jgi:phage/conjugal plasmid C-4 type zinc finger TraR family protein
MADVADIANDQAQYLLDASLRLHASKPSRVSAEFCEDCGEPIPAPRRNAVRGCDTCIDCQSLRERRR